MYNPMTPSRSPGRADCSVTISIHQIPTGVPQILLVTLALAAYLVTSVWFWRRVHARPGTPAETGGADGSRLYPLLVGWTAALLHAWLLARGMLAASALNLSLGYVFSLVTLMTVIVFLLSTLARDMFNLGLFVMPVGLLGLLVGLFPAGQPAPLENPSALQWWHLGIALVAFGFLCIAAAQALLLYLQDRHLHSHRPGNLLPSLPPIQTMENNLFWLTMIGVILLTLNLVVGMVYLYHQQGRTLAFNHHILLSFIAWLGFSGLLCGHRIYGWRGTVAARWTLAAFGVLVLAYFGTRFVTSVVLS